jgi:hypothetical protein
MTGQAGPAPRGGAGQLMPPWLWVWLIGDLAVLIRGRSATSGTSSPSTPATGYPGAADRRADLPAGGILRGFGGVTGEAMYQETRALPPLG